MVSSKTRLISSNYWRNKIRKERIKYYYWRDRKLLTHGKFMHYLFGMETPTPVMLSNQPEVSHDILVRMSDMYIATKDFFVEEKGSLWGDIKSTKGIFISAMEEYNLQVLESQIGNLLKNDLTQGMSHSEEMTDDSRHSYCKNYFSLRTVDLLLSLGEALACCRVQNREQVPIVDAYDYINQNLESLVGRIEEKLLFSIEAPEFGNAPAIMAGTKRLSPDSVAHAYTAHRLKQLGAGKESVVLEIGGGHGTAAMMSRRAGLENYTIVDLPYVSAFQFGFLGSVFDGNAVRAYGEFDPKDVLSSGIKFLPTTAIREMPDGSVDYVVNMDSLPEIPEDAARDYIHEIKRICKGRFLSINQESGRPHPNGQPQGYVPELVEQAGGFKRVSRAPFWMRQGYVEEVYDCSSEG